MMGPRMGMGPDGFGPRHLLGRGPGDYLLFCFVCLFNNKSLCCVLVSL
jgi:hypothetical protein